jgi:hypothetical protein
MDPPHDRTHFSQISATGDYVHETAQYLPDQCMSTLPPTRRPLFYVTPDGQTYMYTVDHYPAYPVYLNQQGSSFPSEREPLDHRQQDCDDQAPSQFCRAEKTACIVPLQTVEEIRGPDDLADYMEGQFGLTNHETVRQDDATGSVQCMSITMGSPPESLRLRDTSVNSVMSVDSDNEGTRLAASLYGNRMGSQVHFSL